MTTREEKFLYIWRLSRFLNEHKTTMSGKELANHLNRNKIRTSYGSEYEGGRGTYRLIGSVWSWVNDVLHLPDEAKAIALAFVDSNDVYAYD